MKKIKAFRLLGLSCLSLSLLLTACEKETILPTPTIPPTTGTPSGTPNLGGQNPGAPGTGTTPPAGPTTTPPSTETGNVLTQVGRTRLMYDTQGRIIRHDQESNMGYEIVYEGEKIKKLVHNDIMGTNRNAYTNYTYTGDKVSEAVMYNGYNEVIYRFQFEYEGSKLVKESKRSYISNTFNVQEYVYDQQDNLVLIRTSGSATGNAADLVQGTDIKFGNYDNKPNPKPYITSHFYLPGIKLSQHNPGYRQTSSSTESFSYTYSPVTDLPTQRQLRLVGYPNAPTDIMEYIYK